MEVKHNNVTIEVRPKKTGWDTLNIEIMRRKLADAITKKNDDNLLILLNTSYIELFARAVVLTVSVNGISYKLPSLGVPTVDILPYFVKWYELEEDLINVWIDALLKVSFSKAGMVEAPEDELTEDEKN